MHVAFIVEGVERELDLDVASGHGTVGDLAAALSWDAPGTAGLVIDGRYWAPDTPLGDLSLRQGAVLQPASGPPPDSGVPASVAVLSVTGGLGAGATLGLQPGRHTLGRDPGEADVLIEDPTVSGTHARIEVSTDGIVVVADPESRNGTVVEGYQPGGPVSLGPGADRPDRRRRCADGPEPPPSTPPCSANPAATARPPSTARPGPWNATPAGLVAYPAPPPKKAARSTRLQHRRHARPGHLRGRHGRRLQQPDDGQLRPPVPGDDGDEPDGGEAPGRQGAGPGQQEVHRGAGDVPARSCSRPARPRSPAAGRRSPTPPRSSAGPPAPASGCGSGGPAHDDFLRASVGSATHALDPVPRVAGVRRAAAEIDETIAQLGWLPSAPLVTDLAAGHTLGVVGDRAAAAGPGPRRDLPAGRPPRPRRPAGGRPHRAGPGRRLGLGQMAPPRPQHRRGVRPPPPGGRPRGPGRGPRRAPGDTGQTLAG